MERFASCGMRLNFIMATDLKENSLFQKNIGITGAAGQIGQRLRRRLIGSPFQLRLFDRNVNIGEVQPSERFEEIDISNWGGLREHFKGLDLVVHLAAVSGEAQWQDIRKSNIDGTYNVFEAARQAGVNRVVFASSHHVYGYYDINDGPLINPEYRPSGLYGVSKCFGEALARTYHDKFDMTFFVLRIAAAADIPSELRHSGVWVSYADTIEAIVAAIQSNATGFCSLNIVSVTPTKVYDDKNWDVLGYSPRQFNVDRRKLSGDDRRCGGSTCDEWFPP
jgi:uronate dehydrogenase